MPPLPQTTQLLYAELLQQCAMALPSRRGVSFSTKTVAGRRYWYLEVVVGSGKKQYSLGPDSSELRALIEKQKALFEQAVPDRRHREKLVAMLNSGGLHSPGAADGRVLELLAQSGVFLSGGVLVGSHAFSAYQGMLGVLWEDGAMRTQDLDIASLGNIPVAIREDAPNVKSVLLESGMGFFEIPALNRKSPSTSFKIRGQEFHVDLLTPMHGPDSAKPIRLPHFNSYAYPMRFLDYLLEDVQLAAVAFRDGVLLNVPSPARFALHKLVVAQRRPVSQQLKSGKDRRQACALIQTLLEQRPGDLWIAREAAQTMPARFQSALKAGIATLDRDLRSSLQ